jgi:hypothetical protein
MTAKPDFAEVHTALRQVMLDHAPGMTVAKDEPGDFILRASFANPWNPKEPMFFGMVRQGKAYVSCHLMALYMNPVLTAQVPPNLKKRMQGLTCFNFKTVDPGLFAELGALTALCAQDFEAGITQAVADYRAAKAKPK